MKDADVDQLYDALRITVNLEAQLTNFLGRAERAGKAWANWAKDSKRSPEQSTTMKAALATLGKMAKDAKLVLKDLDKATKEANKQALAKYATGKEYRDKVLVKQHASVRTWEQNGTKFVAQMSKVVPPFPFPKATSAQGVDETVTVDSAKNFSHYLAEMQKSLAKLG